MNHEQRSYEKAKLYFLVAAFLIALPALSNFYSGYTGKFLIASDGLKGDPYFSETVIYVYEHSLWGAKGLILNKPMEQKDRAFYGGPVKKEELEAFLINKPSLVHRWKVQPLTVQPYLKSCFVMPYYKGISAWDVLQLEGEVRNKLWIVKTCDAGVVLRLDHSQMHEALSSSDSRGICEK